MTTQIILLLTISFSLTTARQRPNIILILTDDQDVVLNGLSPLREVRRLIQDKGATFSNAFATTPICCPSRSSILTGLYLHSHKIVNNSLEGGCSGPLWQEKFEGRTFGAALHAEGYRTFYAGKYLNRYGLKGAGGVKHVPTGWDWWIGLVGNSVYYNYTLSVNGSAVRRGDEDADYLTDVLSEYSLSFLREKHVQTEPFLMVVSPPAPHEPFTPARRHKGTFGSVKAPRTPSFNIPVNKTKHWLLRLPPETLPPETVYKIDEAFRNRWESLLAVDELVATITSRLEALGVLKDTYIIFTSDHGFHLGQFGLPWDKRQPYETDIRVPLLVRGPEVYGTTIPHPVLNIDVASTILDMAGLPTKRFGDGLSFLPYINEPQAPSRSFLIEYRGEVDRTHRNCYPGLKSCHPELSCKCFDARNNTFVCLRRLDERVDDVFCVFDDDESFVEFYDLRSDPYQLDNAAGRVSTSVQMKVLQCCRKMSTREKSIDDCFGRLLL